MPVIYGRSNRAARALDDALDHWYVEADEDRAYASSLDPRQRPRFTDRDEIHLTPEDGAWLVEYATHRTEMGIPEPMASARVGTLAGAKKAARRLAAEYSGVEGKRPGGDFDVTGGL